MKILLTTVSLDSRTGGGTAERTRRLALHLVRQGHNCAVASMRGGDIAGELQAAGIAVHFTGTISIRYTVPLIKPAELARLVREADVIHVLGYWNLLSVATTLLATHFVVPYALCAAGEFVGLEQPRPIASAFHFLFGKRMIRNASFLVAITALEKDQILRRFALPHDTVLVVPNGIEEQPAAGETQAPANPLPAGDFVLFVGRLAKVKGPDLLVRAFAEVARDHPDLTLVMAGPDFGMERELRTLVEAEHLSGRVAFTGHLDELDKRAAYHKAQMLAVPSRAEAMSLVALEAGIAATPVLLTDQCGFYTVAEIGGGAVVPATVEGLRRGLLDMLSDRAELTAMGQRLQTFVRSEFAWPTIVHKLVGRFESVIADDTRSRTRDTSALSPRDAE